MTGENRGAARAIISPGVRSLVTDVVIYKYKYSHNRHSNIIRFITIDQVREDIPRYVRGRSPMHQQWCRYRIHSVGTGKSFYKGKSRLLSILTGQHRGAARQHRGVHVRCKSYDTNLFRGVNIPPIDWFWIGGAPWGSPTHSFLSYQIAVGFSQTSTSW